MQAGNIYGQAGGLTNTIGGLNQAGAGMQGMAGQIYGQAGNLYNQANDLERQRLEGILKGGELQQGFQQGQLTENYDKWKMQQAAPWAGIPELLSVLTGGSFQELRKHRAKSKLHESDAGTNGCRIPDHRADRCLSRSKIGGHRAFFWISRPGRSIL